MKRSILVLLSLMMVLIGACSFKSKLDNVTKQEYIIEMLLSFYLKHRHYHPKDINDTFSENVYKRYLKTLDPQKKYFLASDIELFDTYKHELDDLLQKRDIGFFSYSFSILKDRIKQTQEIQNKILKKPFDLSLKETINTDFDSINYAKDIDELTNRIRKTLKSRFLPNYHERKQEQLDSLKKNLNHIAITDKKLQEEAKESIISSIEDFTENDAFSAFVNAVMLEFDPHTYYFAPKDEDQFNISISGKLEGIGARLQRKDDKVKIVELISGAPAWRDQRLEVGDYIIKVRQEKELKPVSIVGMPLDDAITLIKGPKGTTIYLTVQKVDGTTQVIDLVRDVVELEETYLKSTYVTYNDKRYGVIHLPKFYFSFENYSKGRNAASDMKQEIKRLKKLNIEGIIIDLRGNGGGSLHTVVEMAGLFIKKGPVVQIKSKSGNLQVLEDVDKDILWNGRLAILVDETSASASEILAAAMQDYKRAIIIGSKQTYGKGTVQTFDDMDRQNAYPNFGKLGAVKFTTQKYYRITGESTQLEGVKSDIITPDRYMYIDIGERDEENPLTWDQIKSSKYQEINSYKNFNQVINRSKNRIKSNTHFTLIDNHAKWIKKQRDTNLFSLNYDNYVNRVHTLEKESKAFDSIKRYENNLVYKSLPYELNLMQTDSILRKKRNNWHENLQHDLYLEEALKVLEDLQMNEE